MWRETRVAAATECGPFQPRQFLSLSPVQGTRCLLSVVLSGQGRRQELCVWTRIRKQYILGWATVGKTSLSSQSCSLLVCSGLITGMIGTQGLQQCFLTFVSCWSGDYDLSFVNWIIKIRLQEPQSQPKVLENMFALMWHTFDFRIPLNSQIYEGLQRAFGN